MGTRRDSVLGEHREVIRDAAARNKADSIALVGSVARGDDTDDSDCDFLARFVEGASLFDQAGLKLDLEKLLGCDVDVVSVGGLKDKQAACSPTQSRCEQPRPRPHRAHRARRAPPQKDR